ncbi:LytTR family DNA-binding domain-containing protein [Lysinibacillus sp. 54212]|uniref:LytTR family DNA-binding domain-containing protein n=1 Tax=Lysinibacillus sp. 54212 TaxID=3119829 RepID=UPI002FCBC29A
MKIQLIIDENIQETEIQIRASQYNEQIERLMKRLQDLQTTVAIDGYLQQEIHMLKIKDIYYIYGEGAKVFLQTVNQEFESKRKLYELELMLSHDFVRVSKSTLVNIDKISSIQMSRIGSTEIILDDESSVHVSRKYFKELKMRLGIGRD